MNGRNFFRSINEKLKNIGNSNFSTRYDYDLLDIPYKEDGGKWQQYKDTNEENKFITIVKDSKNVTVAVLEYFRIFDKQDKIILIKEWYKG